MFIYRKIGRHTRVVIFGFKLRNFGLGFKTDYTNHDTKECSYKSFSLDLFILFLRISISIYNHKLS